MQLRPIGKRGISHIEMILSFIIFAGFVIFALFFFSPTRTSRLVDSTLAYSDKEISDNLTVEVDHLAITLKPSTAGGDIDIEIRDIGDTKNIRATTEDGTFVNAARNRDTTSIDTRGLDYGAGNAIVLLYYSEIFPENSLSGTSTTDFEITTKETLEILSEERANELTTLYDTETGYQKLQKEFNLPGRVHFGYTLKLEDGTEITTASKTKPDNLQVNTQTNNYPLILNDGSITQSELTVQIW